MYAGENVLVGGDVTWILKVGRIQECNHIEKCIQKSKTQK